MVAVPIVIIAVASVVLRPMRSPICPNTTAPTGRARNPTVKVLKEAINATNEGRVAEKNTVGKTSAAAVAYRKKSYHSILAPARPVRASFSAAVSRAGVRWAESARKGHSLFILHPLRHSVRASPRPVPVSHLRALPRDRRNGRPCRERWRSLYRAR